MKGDKRGLLWADNSSGGVGGGADWMVSDRVTQGLFVGSRVTPQTVLVDRFVKFLWKKTQTDTNVGGHLFFTVAWGE